MNLHLSLQLFFRDTCQVARCIQAGALPGLYANSSVFQPISTILF